MDDIPVFEPELEMSPAELWDFFNNMNLKELIAYFSKNAISNKQ